ncbi:polysaccharide biosynthesis/export family protein [Halothiobacillus sp.]|uniref:polysaccharide biosynthesis/export family protein n=1 Tax=Halothiobacillus sp. TaxID=1891311 RepID=UPI00261CE9D1|nr:polysaccharide biosynthesis/export family protein [Halothiobacillus sp.]
MNQQPNAPILLLPIDAQINQMLAVAQKHDNFALGLTPAPRPNYVIGPGDELNVAVWEAPPPVLFTSGLASVTGGMSSSAGNVTFPSQRVSADGTISIPFAGTIKVAGYSPQQVSARIRKALKGLANDPQVLVQVPSNASAMVTVVGDVQQSIRMPLTAAGLHLLDALAAAGGARDPVDKETVQITRGKEVLSVPLRQVIDNPTQNIALAPNDVITVLNKPMSLTVLGAVAKNDELNFEAQGISLAQALGRAGGLLDNRADARAVFVFRFEQPSVLGKYAKHAPHLENGEVPVVYQLNLIDPAALLMAQNFPMKNKDVLYVANAPAAEFQKFLTIITSSIYSIDRVVAVSAGK